MSPTGSATDRGATLAGEAERRGRIGVLVSGSGSNLQAIMDAVTAGRISADIAVVVSNRPDAYALERARSRGIPAEVIRFEDFADRRAFTERIVEVLESYSVDLVCLAGFTRILDPLLTHRYAGRVMNTHPALLPAFGGEGMYGHHVHEAVLASGARFSGATVHFVTERTDVGPIIIQGVVEVEDDDTPDTLAARVLEVEHRIYPEAVRLFFEGRLEIDGLRVKRRP